MNGQQSGCVIGVASGKGGVGTTSLTINLAIAVARLGCRVGIVDGHFALGNVDVCLGLTPARHIGHVLDGETPLDEVLLTGPEGVRVLPASAGVPALSALSGAQRERLAGVVGRLRERMDYVFIDGPAGLSAGAIETVTLADRLLLVTAAEPAAVVGAYAAVKAIAAAAPALEMDVVVNGVNGPAAAIRAYRQLDAVASQFLPRSPRYCGFVAFDPAMREATAAQRAVLEFRPDAAASHGVRLLAARVTGIDPAGRRLRVVGGTTFRPRNPEVPQCA